MKENIKELQTEENLKAVRMELVKKMQDAWIDKDYELGRSLNASLIATVEINSQIYKELMEIRNQNRDEYNKKINSINDLLLRLGFFERQDTVIGFKKETDEAFLNDLITKTVDVILRYDLIKKE